MERPSNATFTGVALVAAVAIALGGRGLVHPEKSGGGEAPARVSKAEGGTSPHDSDGDWPLKPVWDFWDAEKHEPDSSSPLFRVEYPGTGADLEIHPGKAKEKPDWYKWPTLHNVRFRFLFCTVPDPVDSGLASHFDQVVEAIQRGAENCDNESPYVMDRAWLPWRRGEKDRKDQRLNEQWPGVLLCRARPAEGDFRTRLLVIFLIGETPTTGIHKVAFANAFEMMTRCPRKLLDPQELYRLRVVGPYFSGSEGSLRIALAQAKRKLFVKRGNADVPWKEAAPNTFPAAFPPIKVVNGSAIGMDRLRFQQAWQMPCWPLPSPREIGDFEFAATVLPDQLVRRWVYKYLSNPANPEQGSQPNVIVLLQESNTGYGQGTLRKEKRHPRLLNTEAAEESANLHGAKDDPKLTFRVPFPIHISQLRITHAREQVARLDALGLPRAGSDSLFPKEEMDQSEKARAVLEVQNPVLTTTTNDLLLGNMTTIMVEKQARYVGIIATDIRDQIFLASLIRDRHPDVQLFTTVSDVLLTHPDYRYDLRGIVVGSTYPLRPGYQGWSMSSEGLDRTRLIFGTQPAEGCYNATLIQLRKHPERLLDYGWSTNSATRPGIWISVVSQNGQLVPVYHVSAEQIYEDLKHNALPPNSVDATDGYMYVRTKAEPKAEAAAAGQGGNTAARAAFPVGGVIFPGLWLVLFLAVTVPAAIVLERFGYRRIRDCEWSEDPQDRLNLYKQRIDFAVACAAVLALYGWIAELFLTPLRLADVDRDRWGYAGGLLVLLLSMFAIMAATALLIGLYLQRVGGKSPWFCGDWSVLEKDLANHWAAVEPWKSSAEPTEKWRACGAWTLAILDVIAPTAIGGLLFLELCFLLVSSGYALSRLVFSVLRFCWTAKPPSWLADVGVPSWSDHDAQNLIDFDRFIRVSDGVSPLLPTFFLCAAAFTWSLFFIKKLYLARKFSVCCPFPEEAHGLFADLHQLDTRSRAEIMPPSTLQTHPGWCALVFVLLLLAFMKLGHRAEAWASIATFDSPWFGRLALLGFFVGCFLLVFTLLQFWLAWKRVRRMLRLIVLLPMAQAFDRLPDKVAGIFGQYYHGLKPRRSHLRMMVQQAGYLYDRWVRFIKIHGARAERGPWNGPVGEWPAKAVRATMSFPAQGLADIRAEFENKVNAADERDYEAGDNSTNRTDIATMLSDYVRECLGNLQGYWSCYSLERSYGHITHVEDGPPKNRGAGPTGEQHSDDPAARSDSEPADPIGTWVVAAEDYAALGIIRYLSQFAMHLRNLLNSLVVGSLLMIMAAASYPFCPQNLLLLFLMVLGGAACIMIVCFLVQLNRDELVSRIMRTTPNRFTPDWTFTQNIVTYVLPIMAAVTIWFPSLTGGIFNMIEPVLHLIH